MDFEFDIKTLEEINEEKIKLDKDYLKTAEEYSKRIREIQEEETEFFDKEIKKRNEILDNFRANIEHTTKALNKLNMPSNRQWDQITNNRYINQDIDINNQQDVESFFNILRTSI